METQTHEPSMVASRATVQDVLKRYGVQNIDEATIDRVIAQARAQAVEQQHHHQHMYTKHNQSNLTGTGTTHTGSDVAGQGTQPSQSITPNTTTVTHTTKTTTGGTTGGTTTTTTATATRGTASTNEYIKAKSPQRSPHHTDEMKRGDMITSANNNVASELQRYYFTAGHQQQLTAPAPPPGHLADDDDEDEEYEEADGEDGENDDDDQRFDDVVEQQKGQELGQRSIDEQDYGDDDDRDPVAHIEGPLTRYHRQHPLHSHDPLRPLPHPASSLFTSASPVPGARGTTNAPPQGGGGGHPTVRNQNKTTGDASVHQHHDHMYDGRVISGGARGVGGGGEGEREVLISPQRPGVSRSVTTREYQHSMYKQQQQPRQTRSAKHFDPTTSTATKLSVAAKKHYHHHHHDEDEKEHEGDNIMKVKKAKTTRIAAIDDADDDVDDDEFHHHHYYSHAHNHDSNDSVIYDLAPKDYLVGGRNHCLRSGPKGSPLWRASEGNRGGLCRHHHHTDNGSQSRQRRPTTNNSSSRGLPLVPSFAGAASAPRRRPTDAVARGKEMRDYWKSDRFLNQRKPRQKLRWEVRKHLARRDVIDQGPVNTADTEYTTQQQQQHMQYSYDPEYAY